MKKMVAVGLAGLALGLVIPGVFAQAPQAEVQKWEQFCETHRSQRGTDKVVKAANPSAAEHGKRGFQLVSVAGGLQGSVVLCYRRPAR